MKLLGTALSPYTRKVRLVLLEKNIPHDYQNDMPRDPDSLAARLNPLGKIPLLVLDDDSLLFDSPVICEYADSLNDAPVLIPRSDPRLRARVKCWEALADGIMDAAVGMRLESLRPADRQDPDVLKRHDTAIGRSLDFASRLLNANTYVVGDRLTLGDLALVSALVYLDVRQPERPWREQYPNLAPWYTHMSERPSVQTSLND